MSSSGQTSLRFSAVSAAAVRARVWLASLFALVVVTVVLHGCGHARPAALNCTAGIDDCMRACPDVLGLETGGPDERAHTHPRNLPPDATCEERCFELCERESQDKAVVPGEQPDS